MIIALTGKKRSGKDTMASSIVDWGYRRLSFSDQLKRITHSIFPWVALDYPQGAKDHKCFDTPKGMLSPRDMWLNMNLVTQLDKNILVDSLVREMEENPSEKYIITDLRKPEELEWIQSKGITIIEIIDTDERTDEDDIEAFISHIQPDYNLFNNKDEDSILRFQQIIKHIETK